MNPERVSTAILQKKHSYNLFQKVCCCRCFKCCQDTNILTRQNRKEILKKLISKDMLSLNNLFYDSLNLMILIYLNSDELIIKQKIERCIITPSLGISTYRTDLQFYIPQICSYLVFNAQPKEQLYLKDTLQLVSKINFYFGHLVYYNLLSLETIIENKIEQKKFSKVTQYKFKLINLLCNTYKKKYEILNCFAFYKPKQFEYRKSMQASLHIQQYGTKIFQDLINQKITSESIFLKNYIPYFQLPALQIYKQSKYQSFMSNIFFFEDLFEISNQLKNYQNKKQKLQEFVLEINKKLPAAVYVPFFKDSVNYYNVLNIIPQECRVFSTKQRAPFYLCLEVYCPCETLTENEQQRFWQKIQKPQCIQFIHKPITYTNTVQGYQHNIYRQRQRTTRISNIMIHKLYSSSIIASRSKSQIELSSEFVKKNQQIQSNLSIKRQKLQKTFNSLFGLTYDQIQAKYRKRSVFSSFKTWKLVHVIIKTGDDLKQQQFALQLIHQFDYIFKLQNLALPLTPYEVVSMGSDYGIIEMVKQSITIDGLKKQLHKILPKENLTLKQFFQINFADNLVEAKQQFVKSLAAYSLVMYFLQVKDRHNGNIMLHQSGKIFHIDFGFFLSNMPGKGLQIQRDIPFKMLSEYIDVLDGIQSSYFEMFRQYLFKGFKAARKHQNKILILVKMMYSSSGMTMPCFEKGQQAITQLEQRFNPPQVINDAGLNFHLQKIIDKSLDNWAGKWYDRWQYWAQGIFY